MSKDDCLGCLCGCGAILGVLALTAGCVSIVVFSIMGLVEDWDLVEECENSKMHVYMIVSLVFALMSGGSSAKGSNEESIGAYICSVCLSIAMFVWGLVEVVDRSCSALDHSLLWDMTLTIVCLHGIIILMTIILLIMMCCKA